MHRFAFRDLAFALKNTAIVVGLLAASNACGGGGCGGGCAGSSVIPGGFPKERRAQNAAGVRLTRPGLDFLQKQLPAIVRTALASSAPGGVITFEIPESSGEMAILKYKLCYGGPKPTEKPPKCEVEIDVGSIHDVKLEAITPHSLKITAKVPMRLQRLPIETRDLLGNSPAYASATVGEGTCDDVKYVPLPVTADVSLEQVPGDPLHAVRAGYTKINIDSKKFTLDQQKIKDNFKFCGGSAMDGFLNLFKGLIADSIVGSLGDKLAAPLAEATCMKAQVLPDGTAQCPTGTFDRKGTCRYVDKDDGECVPMLLGMESRFDLAGLLASVSPGSSGGLDFLLASGGDMKPAPGTGPTVNGVTLGMLGGAEPQPISTCVPRAEGVVPTGIELPDLLSANEVPDWKATTPAHLGIGLAERYLNHAALGAYNSGLLCIGISSEQVAQLNGGLFSLLLPSIEGLADRFEPGETKPAMALAIRPQKPPTIRVGDNTPDFSSPLLQLSMPDTDLDFYMWSHDRFIRLFTGRIDVGVPINLEPGKDGIALKFPAKTPLSFKNPRVSNNTVLLESDAEVGKLVESVGGLIPASTFSSIAPIKLDSALASFGLKLTIPEGGIRKLEKNEDRFLGVFGYLEAAAAAIPTTKTTARVAEVVVDPRNFVLATLGDAPPRVTVHAKAAEDDGSRKVEYAYRVDRGVWSTFFPERDFVVTSPFFVLQGKHTIEVTSRVSGVIESEGEPVSLPVLIDVLPPRVKAQSTTAGTVKIVAADIVSAAADVKVEAKVDDGPWIDVPFAAGARVLRVPFEAAAIAVRATDEAGNVATTTAPLIRGRADATVPGGSGCGCGVPGRTGSSVAAAVAAALALIAARHRSARRPR
ncbi:MAG: hypothetical protein HYV09_00900 [Deltaproteobacteria bacterium]|nr:hypothetical protein [Deltaproteobacteria bacterium]